MAFCFPIRSLIAYVVFLVMFKRSKLSFMLNFNHTAPNCKILKTLLARQDDILKQVQQFMSSSRSRLCKMEIRTNY
ncbi:hypothetical protein H5410_041491 [Solanum commersonii]|uniref:Uncharacterized protein n=1 Tax=Solanum commersonii TaxID=4109 RepID=A0A9J5XS13_SOLCO|nr:hypothetical protein H5410_041491 [Solanum commersonii]